MPKFKRVILKLSGEALAGSKPFGLDIETIDKIAVEVARVNRMGTQVAIVVGGGNIWRGRSGEGMDRATSDYIGMLGTTINALALQDSLEKIGVETRVQTSIDMKQVAEPYIRRRAIRHLEKNRVVIFSAGTGLPYFSTDTTAALRSLEIDSEIILLGKTGTDAIYDKDPNEYNDAFKFETLTYNQILAKELKIMDTTATSLCKDNKMNLLVFGIDDPSNLVKIIKGEKLGTIVKE